MSVLQAIVLGLVQGITEFLPISSTAHLSIVPALLGWEDPGAAFSAIIQLGTVGAVLVYFAKDLLALTAAFIKGLRDRKPFGTLESRLAWFVGVGSIPITVLGLLFKKRIENDFRSLWVMAIALIVLGVLLFISERIASHTRTVEHMTWRDALIIGSFQAVALVPGSSRSGTTLTAGLGLGFTRADAARYSFLLSIPATTGAGLLKLKDVLHAHDADTTLLAIGTIVSFVSGLAAIWGLLKFLKTRSTLVFVVYRVVLGSALIALLATGVLHG